MPRTQDSVRQVDLHKPGLTIPESSENEHINLSEVEEIEEFDVLIENDEYPYAEQKIYRGRFEYRREARLGVSQARGQFELRTGSGLLIIRVEQGRADHQSILDAFDSLVGNDVEIHRKSVFSREGIWEFIDSAEDRDVTIVSPRGSVKLDELLAVGSRSYEGIKGKMPVEEASLLFERTDDDGQTHSINVIYDGEKISVSSQEPDDLEYILQRFEVDVIA